KLFTGVKKGAEGIKDPSDIVSSFVKSGEPHSPRNANRKKSSENKPALSFQNEPEKQEIPSPQSRAKTSKEQLAKYRKAVEKLKNHYIGEQGSLKEEISSSITVWNPLMDGKAKSDLIEDVNSMIRDYIRGMKKGFAHKPPDISRIRNIAEHLAENSAFEKIKKKEEFIRYMELYIVSILAKK
ncbi:MAG: hypothetical protein L3J12_02515, partial [Spirochaetales bacterium]|nr:hypothetical protein [Spirochaetales bacterium]